jgi:hypothetical protein
MFDPHPTKKAKGGDVSKDTSKGIQTQTYLINEIPSAEPTPVTSSPMSYEELVAQMDRIAATPNAKTPSPTPDKTQTESQTMLERFTSLDTPQDMGLGETVADIGMGFLPVVGTAQGARDFERARRDSDKLGMALSAASMIPIAGGAVKAARSVGKAAKAADDLAAVTTNGLKTFLANSKAPKVLYTGTSKDTDFDSFRVPKNGAWFTENPTSASEYAMENDSMGLTYDPDVRNYVSKNAASRVMPVHVRIENPYTMTDADHTFINTSSGRDGANYKKGQGVLFDLLRAQGYDGVDMGRGNWVALKDSTQIKSAIGNVGTFDPKSKNMNKAKGGPIIKKAKGGNVERVYNDRKYI